MAQLSSMLTVMTWRHGMGAGVIGGSLKRDGKYVSTQLIHDVVEQKLTQQCKVIILQLKINFKKYRCSGTPPDLTMQNSQR